jgi:hypothetical protein
MIMKYPKTKLVFTIGNIVNCKEVQIKREFKITARKPGKYD